MLLKLVSYSQPSSCLSLLSSRVMDVSHQHWFLLVFYIAILNVLCSISAHPISLFHIEAFQ